jgi:lincosamide nucleotidyltransferase A/C/D/E
MDADAVLQVLTRLCAANLDVWIAGGWGIDALVGRQTRPHRDLDLIHDVEHEDRLVDTLMENGYVEALDLRPIRFVMANSAGVELDLHPLVFAEDGSARQAADDLGGTFTYPAGCFVAGRIQGTAVPCLSVTQQVYFHQGYEPQKQDLHDMAQLRTSFGITTHF